jgi:hypothetical protein
MGNKKKKPEDPKEHRELDRGACSVSILISFRFGFMQEKHLILITLCIFYSKKHRPSYITRKKKKKKLREHTNKFRSFSLLLDWRDKKTETLNDNVVFVPRDPRFQKNILEKSELY